MVCWLLNPKVHTGDHTSWETKDLERNHHELPSIQIKGLDGGEGKKNEKERRLESPVRLACLVTASSLSLCSLGPTLINCNFHKALHLGPHDCKHIQTHPSWSPHSPLSPQKDILLTINDLKHRNRIKQSSFLARLLCGVSFLSFRLLFKRAHTFSPP